MKSAVLFVSLWACFALTQTPPRDTRPPASDPGSMKPATISGRVVVAGTTQPARNTAVRLRSAKPGTRSSSSMPDLATAPAAVTDADGRFTASNVPPGTYTLSASKTAFLTTYFKPRPDGRSGETFEVGPGEVIDVGVLPLRRGGVITGRVVDDAGEPLQFVSIAVARWETFEDALNRETGRVTTDDRGAFRIYGLEPGEYIVTARPSPAPTFQDARYATDLAPTYYPGTVWLNDARPVRVGPGQEVAGVDLALQLIRNTRLHGVVTDSKGTPLDHGSLSLELHHRSRFVVKDHDLSLTEQGSFELADVAPGEYVGTVVGRTREGAAEPPEAAMFSLKVTGEPAGENPSRAGFRPPVSIAITTSPAAQAFGSVHFESVDGARPSLTGAELRAEGARKRQIRTTRLEWKADGSFQLRGLYGRLLLRWSNLPSGWTVKEMRLAGRDVSSETLDFVPGTPPVGPLDVVFVRR